MVYCPPADLGFSAGATSFQARQLVNLAIEGKFALVLGASRGIGKQVARLLGEAGCRVLTVARAGDVDLHADMMSAEAREQIARAYKPDIVYYCIGGSYGGIKDWRAPACDWQKVWQFNLGIAVELNRHFVPHMLERKWGRVVMTSTDGTKCNSGNPPYTSAKFALEGYVKTVAKHWAKDNVILTAVAPGHVYTTGRFLYSQNEEWTRDYMQHHAPIGRWAADEEVAKVVAFLCSGHSSYMAGSIVRVDGASR